MGPQEIASRRAPLVRLDHPAFAEGTETPALPEAVEAIEAPEVLKQAEAARDFATALGEAITTDDGSTFVGSIKTPKTPSRRWV